MILNLIYFLAGLSLLFLGGDLLVRACQALAIYLKKKTFFISLFLLGMGTSAPELFVTIQSHLDGEASIAMGNIVGSNIFNILIVSALIILSSYKGLNLDESLKSTALLVGTTFFFFILGLNSLFSRWEGVALLFLFAVFLMFSYDQKKSPPQEKQKTSSWILVLFTVFGFAFLFLGAKVTIDSAVQIGQQIGLSKRLVGLFLVSIGTSLPELVVAGVALFKKDSEIALGSIVGSNGFNTFFIPGVASVLSPLEISSEILIKDGSVMWGSEWLLLLTLWIFKKPPRYISFIFISIYIGYLYFIFS